MSDRPTTEDNPAEPQPAMTSSPETLRDEAVEQIVTLTERFHERGDAALGSRLAEALKAREQGLNLDAMGFASFAALLFHAKELGRIALDRPGNVGDWEAMPPGRPPIRAQKTVSQATVSSTLKYPQVRTDVWQAVTEWDPAITTLVSRRDLRIRSVRGDESTVTDTVASEEERELPRLPANDQLNLMRRLVAELPLERREQATEEFERVTGASNTPVRAARPFLQQEGLSNRWSGELVRAVTDALDQWSTDNAFPRRWYQVPAESAVPRPPSANVARTKDEIGPALTRLGAALDEVAALHRSGQAVAVEITIRIG